MIVQLKILPDEFERCWHSGMMTLQHLKAVGHAVKQMREEIDNPPETIETKPTGRNTVVTKKQVSAPSMMDSDALIQQINLDKKFKHNE